MKQGAHGLEEAVPIPHAQPSDMGEPSPALMDRPLDTVEQVFRALNATGAARFVQVAQIAGDLDQDRLEEAVRAVQARHAALRRVVVRHEHRWWFRQTEQPAEILTVKVDGPRELLLQEMDTELPASVPFRVSFDPGAPGGPRLLGFTFHHSALDGLSGRVVLDDLLLAATGIARPPWPEAPPLDNRAPVLRSPLSPLRLRWRHLRVRMAAAFGRRDSQVFHGRTHTGLTLRTVPAAVMTRLRSQARARGASITGVLTAVSAEEVRKVHGERALAPVSISVSLRGVVVPPVLERDLGCFVTTALVPARSAPVWNVARSMTRAIANQIASGDAHEGLRASRARASKLDEHFARLAASPAAHGPVPTLAITNRGDWRPGQTTLNVQKLFFLATSDPIGPWYQLNCESLDGELQLCLSYLVPLVSPERAEAIADAIGTRLEALAGREGGGR